MVAAFLLGKEDEPLTIDHYLLWINKFTTQLIMGELTVGLCCSFHLSLC